MIRGLFAQLEASRSPQGPLRLGGGVTSAALQFDDQRLNVPRLPSDQPRPAGQTSFHIAMAPRSEFDELRPSAPRLPLEQPRSATQHAMAPRSEFDIVQRDPGEPDDPILVNPHWPASEPRRGDRYKEWLTRHARGRNLYVRAPEGSREQVKALLEKFGPVESVSHMPGFVLMGDESSAARVIAETCWMKFAGGPFWVNLDDFGGRPAATVELRRPGMSEAQRAWAAKLSPAQVRRLRDDDGVFQTWLARTAEPARAQTREAAAPRREIPLMPPVLPVGDAVAEVDAGELNTFLGACGSGMLKDIRAWIAAGKPVNQANTKTKRTGLHVAAEKGLVSVIEILLDAGADPYAKNSAGETPIAVARRVGAFDVVAIFQKRGVQLRG